MTKKELIQKAADVIRPRKHKDYLMGDVGCALETLDGNVYIGTCADVDSNTFCAEKIAIGSMITNQEYQIKKIVAVWKDEDGQRFVIPPCGNCRELMKQVDDNNLSTEVLLSASKSSKLSDLLPHHDSWEKVE